MSSTPTISTRKVGTTEVSGASFTYILWIKFCDCIDVRHDTAISQGIMGLGGMAYGAAGTDEERFKVCTRTLFS